MGWTWSPCSLRPFLYVSTVLGCETAYSLSASSQLEKCHKDGFASAIIKLNCTTCCLYFRNWGNKKVFHSFIYHQQVIHIRLKYYDPRKIIKRYCRSSHMVIQWTLNLVIHREWAGYTTIPIPHNLLRIVNQMWYIFSYPNAKPRLKNTSQFLCRVSWRSRTSLRTLLHQ